MNLIERDQAAIWHPYTQHQISSPPFAITRGEGAYLFDETGKRYLDLISSWWVNLHGHCHPEIVRAIHNQAQKLEHVIFGGFTHEPAVLLAEALLKLLPDDFSKVFYSDNGSTAVEVALKMAYQYWHNRGESARKRFIAFENGYHGDTFGAMSVGKRQHFFEPFSDLLFDVTLFPYPATWLDDQDVERKEQQILTQMTGYLEEFGLQTAALIIEPLVQGVAGMHTARPQFMRELERLVRSYGVLIIYDEVMTGFGRTGDFFACNKTNTSPDMICLAKGMTGGFLPLAATICKNTIYQAFLGDTFSKALAHGHSFTANPLGCAAALASLELLQKPETVMQISMIEKVHRDTLTHLLQDLPIEKSRYCGTIAAFDVSVNTEYGSDFSVKLREKFAEQGLLIRPLGNSIYLIPPYCITEHELRSAYEIIVEEIGVIA
ncbi:MAG: adenosylmethionine--8-amino-7-oxononanoate transaminase [Gammaproteobacteria bacterium]